MIPTHLKSGVLRLAFPPVGAASTQERRRDFTAPLAFHVYKVRTGVLHQATFLVFPLLLFQRGVKEIHPPREARPCRAHYPQKSYFLVFEAGFHCAALAAPQLMTILLHQPPACYNYRCVPSLSFSLRLYNWLKKCLQK